MLNHTCLHHINIFITVNIDNRYVIFGYFANNHFYIDFTRNYNTREPENNNIKRFVTVGICISLVVIVLLFAVIFWIENKKQISDDKDEIKSYNLEKWNFSPGLCLSNIKEDPFADDFKEENL